MFITPGEARILIHVLKKDWKMGFKQIRQFFKYHKIVINRGILDV